MKIQWKILFIRCKNCLDLDKYLKYIGSVECTELLNSTKKIVH